MRIGLAEPRTPSTSARLCFWCVRSCLRPYDAPRIDTALTGKKTEGDGDDANTTSKSDLARQKGAIDAREIGRPSPRFKCSATNTVSVRWRKRGAKRGARWRGRRRPRSSIVSRRPPRPLHRSVQSAVNGGTGGIRSERKATLQCSLVRAAARPRLKARAFAISQKEGLRGLWSRHSSHLRLRRRASFSLFCSVI